MDKRQEGKRTINSVQSISIKQYPRGTNKDLRFRPALDDKSEIVASLAAATDGEDHAQPGMLLFQLDEGAETAGCAVDGDLVVGMFIAQL